MTEESYDVIVVGGGAGGTPTDLHNAKFGAGDRRPITVQWGKDESRKVVWPKNLASGEYLLQPAKNNQKE